MVDRVRGYVIGARGFLTWTWPFLLAVAVTANLIVLTLLISRQADVIRDSQEGTKINRRLIQRGLPCLEDGDPKGEACVTERIRAQQLADALAAVQAQHDAQAMSLDDAVKRIIELQERQHGVSIIEAPRSATTIPLRPKAGVVVKPTTTVAPRTTTTAAPRVTTTTAAPSTTTTICSPPDCKPNKP